MEMQAYVGTKIILAKPMSNFEFRRSKGADVADFETDEEGYYVAYPNGYTSWSPKGVFEACYRPVSQNEAFMSFHSAHPSRVNITYRPSPTLTPQDAPPVYSGPYGEEE